MVDIRQEEYKTRQRILYANNPNKVDSPDKHLREEFDKLRATKGINSFAISPVVNVDLFLKFLLEHPEIQKIYSVYLDTFESLPYRPDMAFDSIWRALEALIKRYAIEAWGVTYGTSDIVSTMGRICKEAIAPIINNDSRLSNGLESIIALIPISIGRYSLARMLCDREIRIASQYGPILDRVKRILCSDLYELYKNRYSQDGVVDSKSHYDGARKIVRMICKKNMTFFGKPVDNLKDFQRWEFVMSVIIYTSRCERYHGDFFSPFYSALAKMDTYRHWYWLLITTHAFFWILFMKYCEYIGVNILDADSVSECLERNAENLTKLMS